MAPPANRHSIEIRRGANLITQAVIRHEILCHDGDPCPDERVNALAFLGHKLGIRSDEDGWDELAAALRVRILDYEAVHAEHEPHHHG